MAGETKMQRPASLLDELRSQYEAAREFPQGHAEVETFQAIDSRMRAAFRWLEKAITYLDGLKPLVQHRYDVGRGVAFEAPRFRRGSVGQHTRRVAGYPVLDEINIYYEIGAAKTLILDVGHGEAAATEKALDDVGLQYTSRSVEDASGSVHKCSIAVPPSIPAMVSFKVDYETGRVVVAMVNVDRLDRIALEFESKAIEEPVLEDLVRLILGRDAAFLRRAPLAGLHPRPPS